MLYIKELYETCYQDYYVTRENEVYSLHGNKPILKMKQNDNGNGYKYVRIKGKNVSVHRLMAQAFLGLDITNSELQVNHLDAVPSNNSIYNLKICNALENQRHAQRLKIMRKACRGLHVSSKSIE